MNDKPFGLNLIRHFTIPILGNGFIIDNLWDRLYLIIILLLIIITSFYLLGGFRNMKIHSRKFFTYFLWLFILLISMYFIIPSVSTEIYIIISIPLSFLFSNFFVNIRSIWVGEVLLDLLLAIIIINQVM